MKAYCTHFLYTISTFALQFVWMYLSSITNLQWAKEKQDKGLDWCIDFKCVIMLKTNYFDFSFYVIIEIVIDFRVPTCITLEKKFTNMKSPFFNVYILTEHIIMFHCKVTLYYSQNYSYCSALHCKCLNITLPWSRYWLL